MSAMPCICGLHRVYLHMPSTEPLSVEHQRPEVEEKAAVEDNVLSLLFGCAVGRGALYAGVGE